MAAITIEFDDGTIVYVSSSDDDAERVVTYLESEMHLPINFKA